MLNDGPEVSEESIAMGLNHYLSKFSPMKSFASSRIEGNEDSKGASSDDGSERQNVSNRWAGKGLALNSLGKIPQGIAGIRHCFKELGSGITRGAVAGFLIKGGMVLLFSLIRGKSNPQKLVKAILSRDVLSFVRFLATCLGTFRFVNSVCACIRRKDTSANSAIAGVFAGLTVLLDEQSRRQEIALFLFVRSIDVFVKQLVRQGILPYWKHAESFLFGVMNMPIMYGFLFEPDILQRNYYKWILNMGEISDEALKTTLRDRREHFFQTGELIPFRHCSHAYHQGPCTVYCVVDWFKGLVRASKIYFPVHFIPLVLFRWRALLKDPSTQMLKTLSAMLYSCVFLSSYVFCIKGSNCFLRNAREVDSSWHALFAGMLTSLACVFERNSRVSELMLYCVPKALEATWAYLLKYGFVKNIKNFEGVFAAIGMSLLFSASRRDFKLAYHQSLCFLIGSS